MSKSKVYLYTSQCKVTNEFLTIENSRYYMRNINAVFVTRQATYRRYPILAAILFTIIAITTESIIVLIIALLFILIAYLMKTNYHLRLKLYTGEIRPLISTNRTMLEDIKKAIECALMDSAQIEQEEE